MSDLQGKLKYAASTADDWTKTQDKARRKTIQNRLAQRKRRENASRANTVCERDETVRKAPKTGAGKPSSVLTSTASLVCEDSRLQKKPVKTGIDDLPLKKFVQLSALSEHRFLVLSEFSVQRAFVNNATMLAIDAAVLADYDGLSPWTIMNPFFAPSKSFPQSLSPTPLQLRTHHHPFLDLLAPSGLRDNIHVGVLDDEQEDQLCQSIHEDGLKVWGGQPWSPTGWEFSQSFVDRWGWLMDEGSIDSSNFWRFERGDPPLRLPSAVPAIAEVA